MVLEGSHGHDEDRADPKGPTQGGEAPQAGPPAQMPPQAVGPRHGHPRECPIEVYALDWILGAIKGMSLVRYCSLSIALSFALKDLYLTQLPPGREGLKSGLKMAK